MVEKLTQHRKHVPVRTCIVCRQKADKRALMRVVAAENGVQLDPTGKMKGRGAYLCERDACWQRALTTEVLSKALRTTLTAEDRDRLRLAKP